jgi:hypothetical protein
MTTELVGMELGKDMSGAFEGLWCIVQGKECEGEIQDVCMQLFYLQDEPNDLVISRFVPSDVKWTSDPRSQHSYRPTSTSTCLCPRT